MEKKCITCKGSFSSYHKTQKYCSHICYRKDPNYVNFFKGRVINISKKGESGFTNLFHTYKSRATRRGYSFNLTKKEFRKLVKARCYYCNVVPKQVHNTSYKTKHLSKGHHKYIYNGVDRINNTYGYSVKNSVTCCKVCNRAKDTMNYAEFIRWVKKVYKNKC